MSRPAGVIAAECLPKGVHRRRYLPDPELDALWKSIVVPDEIKRRLLSQAVLNFTVRRTVSNSVLPLHGVIMLVGKPGTGKTSLARGLAHRTADAFDSSEFQLLEIEPHGLTSSAMGKTQRAVSDLFAQAIAEHAAVRPTIVLLDEVETLAVDRSKLSLEANPVDIHRATDAVLIQLDMLAEEHQNLLFVATSNFPEAVDVAFKSRCDLVIEVPLPDQTACRQILEDCLQGLSEHYPAVARLLKSSSFAQCAAECVGLDGRAIRKTVANALASNPEVAMDPAKVTEDHLLEAARSAKRNRGIGGGS